MGSSKKHKKHKSERREKYEEYSNNMDPAHLQRGLKLILKVGSSSTPEYSGDSPLTCASGPPTAAEAMMAAAPSSPGVDDEFNKAEYRGEKHKKSKKKKKKKDREKKHKHHKERRHRRERNDSVHRQNEYLRNASSAECILDSDEQMLDERQPLNKKNVKTILTAPIAATIIVDGDSSQDGFSFVDDENSQPLPENILLYEGITTDNSPSCRPVSKPIVPRKPDELLLAASPMSCSQQPSSMDIDSPTKPLADLLIPSPSASNAAFTPGGSNSMADLTSKLLEAPKTPSSSSESGREPRTCVLKLKQQKSPLNKLLDHLLRFLEKRDPHQFFAWPVTDDIAPGYSSIISKPMDFSTMRQKIDDSEYTTLTEFSGDFKLMCENAVRYNHVDTVYHKAAKRLLQVGVKHLAPENLMRSLKPMSGYMRELTAKELGFELIHHDFDGQGNMDSADEGASTGAEDASTPAQQEEDDKRRALRMENEPKSRYEPYVDDLTSEEILAQVQQAARAAKQRLNNKQKAHKMAFLRQHKDGTTTMNLLIKDENEGPEKVVTLGDVVGKLQTGSGQLQIPREDKRNEAKMVKPLNYGAFTSFAPSFDSRFANMSKEETQLVQQTYGEATSSEYAESILNFTKDSDYASTMANGLLDILTGGEHSKMMQDLQDLQEQYHEQEEVQKVFPLNDTEVSHQEGRVLVEQDFEKYKHTRVDFQRLRSLNDLGIDVSFLDTMETEMKHFELTKRLQEHLHSNMNLIEKLRAKQHERLSQPLPQHLAHVPQAGAEETILANQITQSLTDMAKKLPPAAITEPHALRKAMGVSYVGLAPVTPCNVSQRVPLPEVLQHPVAMPILPNATSALSTANKHVIDLEQNVSAPPASIATATSVADQNAIVDAAPLPMDIDGNWIREFLESGDSALHGNPSSDDTNFVSQLLMN